MLRLATLLRSFVPFALLLHACSSGGGSPAPGSTFELSAISLPENAVWEINREIVLSFNEPLDFSSVSANTIQLHSVEGLPATGVFLLRDEHTVVFQPNCPTRADLSDAGFLPGGVRYELSIPGRNTSANVLRSIHGVPLNVQLRRSFATPASLQPALAFHDVRPGPPLPILRAQGSSTSAATYFELGDEREQRVYLELDEQGELVLSQAGFVLPLNLYSDPRAHVALVIEFDQPVNPSALNLSSTRLRLEYREPLDTWQALETRVTLEANCTASGARVRLEPVGIVPPASALRGVVRAGFQDLVGEVELQALERFAVAPTRSVEFSSLLPADELADELNEAFDSGGNAPRSRQDAGVLFDAPPAEWGAGQLSAAFAFEGTGGPRGTFDWVVHRGERVLLDTVHSSIVGGPNGTPTTTLEVQGGVVDVHDLILEEGAQIRVQGANPLRILATGSVRIEGTLDVSGFNAKDVASIDTGTLREVGGVGVGGGGSGGDANLNTSASSPRGGKGHAPFGLGELGGLGGETAYARGTLGADARRPGGGGGGSFAKAHEGTTIYNGMSLAAGAGTQGSALAQGAETDVSPPLGGAPGAGAFVDGSAANDFFGVRPLLENGELVGLVRGELAGLWAGYGGGGGGNAVPSSSFPNPRWDPNTDEKGGGGGGGGGGVHIRALGAIVFGPQGEILADGARGGLGENTAGTNRIGGTGGGGSGGHVILESATQVDFTRAGASSDGPLREYISACGPQRRRAPASELSHGGPGGGGVIQLHVPDPRRAPGNDVHADALVLPASALLSLDPLDEVTSPPALVMIPSFSKSSKARSRWISIGGADQKADGRTGLVRFLFDGIQTEGEDAGRILTDNGRVRERPPLVDAPDLAHSDSVRLLDGGFQLELEGTALDALRAGQTSGLSNDLYLRTPALLVDCVVRLFDARAPANHEDFSIADARYDEGASAAGDETLRLVVGGGRPLTAFASSGALGFELLPRFFRVQTGGLADALPDSAFVKLRFQAAAANGAGLPDEGQPLTAWITDLRRFNELAPGALQFFRFEVEFDLDARAQGLSPHTEPVRLDFLKIPFVF